MPAIKATTWAVTPQSSKTSQQVQWASLPFLVSVGASPVWLSSGPRSSYDYMWECRCFLFTGKWVCSRCETELEESPPEKMEAEAQDVADSSPGQCVPLLNSGSLLVFISVPCLLSLCCICCIMYCFVMHYSIFIRYYVTNIVLLQEAESTELSGIMLEKYNAL